MRSTHTGLTGIVDDAVDAMYAAYDRCLRLRMVRDELLLQNDAGRARVLQRKRPTFR